MTATIQILLLLLAVLVAVAILARRLNVAPSILLVVAGIGLAAHVVLAVVVRRAVTPGRSG